MINKILEKFFSYMDYVCDGISNLVAEKPKRKKRKCKDCHCNCHCSDDLHLHNDQQDLCTCETCKC